MKKFKTINSLILKKERKALFKNIIQNTDLKENIKNFFKQEKLDIKIYNIDLKNNTIVIICKNSIQASNTRLLQNKFNKQIKRYIKIITKVY